MFDRKSKRKFDGIGPDGVKEEIENAYYGNDCVRPDVKRIEIRDIGEWNDDHPLNHDHSGKEYKRLFSKGVKYL